MNPPAVSRVTRELQRPYCVTRKSLIVPRVDDDDARERKIKKKSALLGSCCAALSVMNFNLVPFLPGDAEHSGRLSFHVCSLNIHLVLHSNYVSEALLL